MKKLKECENCGKEFVPTNSRSLYCCERCREESKRLMKRQRERMGMTKTTMTINEINAKALAERLSYGQYVAKYGL
jgi:DNA-directed RNA polymerase subunit RPC12/RpoP